MIALHDIQRVTDAAHLTGCGLHKAQLKGSFKKHIITRTLTPYGKNNSKIFDTVRNYNSEHWTNTGQIRSPINEVRSLVHFLSDQPSFKNLLHIGAVPLIKNL